MRSEGSVRYIPFGSHKVFISRLSVPPPKSSGVHPLLSISIATSLQQLSPTGGSLSQPCFLNEGRYNLVFSISSFCSPSFRNNFRIFFFTLLLFFSGSNSYSLRFLSALFCSYSIFVAEVLEIFIGSFLKVNILIQRGLCSYLTLFKERQTYKPP